MVWTPERIRAGWETYRTDTWAMLGNLILRMLKEEDRLYLLLAIPRDPNSLPSSGEEDRSNIG